MGLNGAMQNLLPGPSPVLLPVDPAAEAAYREVSSAGTDVDAVLKTVAARFPAYSGGWAGLAERALAAGDPVAGYAYARTGYHRGLDQLRRNGWRGQGPVPWSHEPNQGFLRSVRALGDAAGAIGEVEEAQRCAQLLHDCDPTLASGGAGS